MLLDSEAGLSHLSSSGFPAAALFDLQGYSDMETEASGIECICLDSLPSRSGFWFRGIGRNARFPVWRHGASRCFTRPFALLCTWLSGSSVPGKSAGEIQFDLNSGSFGTGMFPELLCKTSAINIQLRSAFRDRAACAILQTREGWPIGHIPGSWARYIWRTPYISH